MNSLFAGSKLFIKRHGSTILTSIGGAGVIVTSIMAVKSTPKAIKLIEEAREDKGEELTKIETIKVAGKVYIPSIFTGAATIACIFGANVLNKRYQASIMSAYALIDTSFKEYKAKLKELYGEETHQNIIDAIAVEKSNDVGIYSECFCSSCDLSVEENDGKPRLFYEEYSGRYFETTIQQVMSAEYHLNRNYILRGYTVLNELYEFLGLETTDYGSEVGWAPLDDGMYWIDFNHRKITLDDGTVCYILEMPFEPRANYDEYY